MSHTMKIERLPFDVHVLAHGSLLADKQGIQWMIDSKMELYQCKLMVLHAAYKIDRGEDFRSEVSMAKHFVANSLNRVGLKQRDPPLRDCRSTGDRPFDRLRVSGIVL